MYIHAHICVCVCVCIPSAFCVSSPVGTIGACSPLDFKSRVSRSAASELA